MPILRPLPAFQDNIIWALLGDGGDALVIDPGDAAPVELAARAGLKPAAIFVTHHHADHCAGAAQLCERWRIPCFAPEDDRIAAATERVGDGERVALSGLGSFEVISLPGHTRTHIAFHGLGRLFCGDTLFSLGCGRLFEGTAEQMHASLQRLAALPGTTEVCCGHEYTVANARFARTVEPQNQALTARARQAEAVRSAGGCTLPSRLEDELACNPFLRTGQRTVVEAAERRAGRSLGDPTQVFAALRRWKDEYRE